MQEKATALSGFLSIDKLPGPTSHDIVKHVRKLMQAGLPAEALAKAGHAGTLDPFATGVLLVAVGSATRLLEYTRDLPKTYLATITLGATSDTDDRTGKIRPYNTSSPTLLLRKEKGDTIKPDTSPYEGEVSRRPGEVKIQQVLKTFTGPTQQTPPQYSAVKVAGQRAYKQARVGKRVDLKPRPVVIHSIKLLEYSYPTLQLEITCGGGTYIRALARDIGQTLNTGAYVQELRRTAIGLFNETAAVTLDKISPTTLPNHLLPPEKLVEHLPRITLDPTSVAKIQRGQGIHLIPSPSPYEGEVSAALGEVNSPIAIFDESQTLIGIGKYEPMSSLLHPQKVL